MTDSLDTTDEMIRWRAEIPKEIGEQAEERLSYGDKSEAIRRLAEIIAHEGYGDRTPYDAEIRHVESEIEDLQSKRREIDRRIHDREERLDALRENRSEFESTTDTDDDNE